MATIPHKFRFQIDHRKRKHKSLKLELLLSIPIPFTESKQHFFEAVGRGGRDTRYDSPPNHCCGACLCVHAGLINLIRRQMPHHWPIFRLSRNFSSFSMFDIIPLTSSAWSECASRALSWRINSVAFKLFAEPFVVVGDVGRSMQTRFSNSYFVYCLSFVFMPYRRQYKWTDKRPEKLARELAMDKAWIACWLNCKFILNRDRLRDYLCVRKASKSFKGSGCINASPNGLLNCTGRALKCNRSHWLCAEQQAAIKRRPFQW